MSDGLRRRPGPAPKLIEGPSSGQRSLYAQHVLDEDTYTDALSHIIQRDFFPNLPHLHATNDYLSALANNDAGLLSSSIRRLAAIAAEKEGKSGTPRRRRRSEGDGDDRQHAAERERLRREFDMANTPYMNVGARGWDSPEPEEDDDGRRRSRRSPSPAAGPSKRRRANPVRDDLSLDAFQRNYTSEDNASFAQIVDSENKQRRAEKAWAWEAERVAEDKRLAGEERRKMILDVATSGGWRVDAQGRRLIGGLGEGARGDAEAWKERKMITAGESGESELEGKGENAPSSALTLASSSSPNSGALVKHTSATSASALPPPSVTEKSLPADHPLSRALETAGLPTTALVSTSDGAIVPQHEVASGSGEGRGRGAAERAARNSIEKRVMQDDARDKDSTQQWKYKAMNGLMFPPDANEDPYPRARDKDKAPLANPPSIAYRNTRIPEEDDEPSRAGSTVRGSSPARSWVDAAVRGQDYIPPDEREDHALLPTEADPDPEDLPPLMTWGTLLATPRRVDGPDEPPGPSFRLPETKRRDEIGRKLGARAGRSIADRARSYAPEKGSASPRLSDALRAAAKKTKGGDRGSGSMLPPATPQRGNLTPAGRSLLDRSLGRTPQRSGGLGIGSGASARGAAMDRSAGWGRSGVGAKSWTPSPAPRR